jgi:hypothetical protein
MAVRQSTAKGAANPGGPTQTFRTLSSVLRGSHGLLARKRAAGHYLPVWQVRLEEFSGMMQRDLFFFFMDGSPARFSSNDIP